MQFNSTINGNEITVLADSKVFTKEAILKCLYWYGDKFHASVHTLDKGYCLSLIPGNENQVTETELQFYCQKLQRDLIDYQLRDTIAKETLNVRDLLIAKAFSNGEYDEDPPGEISDPLGFDPLEIK